MYTDIYGYIKNIFVNLERTGLVLYRDKIFGIGLAMMFDAGRGMLDLFGFVLFPFRFDFSFFISIFLHINLRV